MSIPSRVLYLDQCEGVVVSLRILLKWLRLKRYSNWMRAVCDQDARPEASQGQENVAFALLWSSSIEVKKCVCGGSQGLDMVHHRSEL